LAILEAASLVSTVRRGRHKHENLAEDAEHEAAAAGWGLCQIIHRSGTAAAAGLVGMSRRCEAELSIAACGPA